jgi:CRP-like cAMP-binding protein
LYGKGHFRDTTTTALANGRSKIEERLARWLLMADDRIDADELPLTHEFLGLMLGTHRPGVTKRPSSLLAAQDRHPQFGGRAVNGRSSSLQEDCFE